MSVLSLFMSDCLGNAQASLRYEQWLAWNQGLTFQNRARSLQGSPVMQDFYLAIFPSVS